MQHRVGIGYDVHRFIAGRPLILGGVTIPSPQGLDGHSDADVLLHAVMDACLGAAGLPDIGTHFPNTDPRYKDCRSVGLLREVVRLVSADGWTVANIDASVIAEAPRLQPHIPAMREAIAAAMGVMVGQVGIKATTNETMGFVGRGEGMAAMAVVLLRK